MWACPVERSGTWACPVERSGTWACPVERSGTWACPVERSGTWACPVERSGTWVRTERSPNIPERVGGRAAPTNACRGDDSAAAGSQSDAGNLAGAASYLAGDAGPAGAAVGRTHGRHGLQLRGARLVRRRAEPAHRTAVQRSADRPDRRPTVRRGGR